MNVWTFTGNLGRDCEQSTTQSGMAICSFAVAVSSGYGDRKQTTWVKVKLFGKQAEGGLPQYLVKGQQVAVSGEATLAEWTKKDGSKGYTLEVVANQVDLIGKRQDNDYQPAPAAPPPQRAQSMKDHAPARPAYQPQEIKEDDIPF